MQKSQNHLVRKTPDESRSSLMKRVRQRDSSPEVSLRSALHSVGLRYRVHVRVERVTVDILFARSRVALLVDGCFWHGCPLHASYPKTNKDYWLPKLVENRERDKRQTAQLQAAGWKVIRVWEHDCLPPSRKLVKQIEEAVRKRK